jgi:hypothetical protein
MGELTHGLFGNQPSFTAGKGCFCCVYGGENFRTASLAFFPEQKRLLHGIFRPVQSAALNGFADEGLLVGGELYSHASNV